MVIGTTLQLQCSNLTYSNSKGRRVKSHLRTISKKAKKNAAVKSSVGRPMKTKSVGCNLSFSPKLSFWVKRPYLTIIWVTSRTLFGRYLLGRLRTYGGQTWQGGGAWSRKKARENESLKFRTVAMEIGKFSHASGINLMVLKFSGSNILRHSNEPTKNEQNRPHSYRAIVIWILSQSQTSSVSRECCISWGVWRQLSKII